MTLFPSFFLGGFESSTMRRRIDLRRNDLVAATEHDIFAAQDYQRLLDVGICAARDGIAWHRIEASAGSYDFASVIERVRVARDMGLHVVWDLCHFGWPNDVDPFLADFPDRFARFARAFARLIRDETDEIPWYAPINEISFVSWAGGDVGWLNPFATQRGRDLKLQLVRAALAATDAVRDVDRRARVAHIDPIIHVVPTDDRQTSVAKANRYNDAQFEAWDLISGRSDQELGGSEDALDVLGVNFYDRNEWVDAATQPLVRSDARYRPLQYLLSDVYQRYRRPLFVAETGAEGDDRVAWLRYVCDEVNDARRAGVPVEGICIYPVLDYPGWDDDRDVPVGLWGYADKRGIRPPYRPLMAELRRQARRFPGC